MVICLRMIYRSAFKRVVYPYISFIDRDLREEKSYFARLLMYNLREWSGQCLVVVKKSR